jgi:hypothetical protein
MGTKNNPGQFDCYHNAEPDEPMFTLLARDATAPFVVRQWAAARRLLVDQGIKPMSDLPVIEEALLCAQQMEDWRRKNR